MSPTQFHDHHHHHQHHAKREIINNNNGMCPSSLKINKDSHFIKKSPSPPSSSSSSASSLAAAAASTKPQQRHPVIIYTHSPKIIHTNPRDFMALVQKLTGLSRSDDDNPPRPKQDPGGGGDTSERETHKTANDDNESSSAITDENCSSTVTVVGNVKMNNSCFASPPTRTRTRTSFDPPNPCFNNIPLFTPNSSEFLCPSQPFYNNYADSLLFMPNMRNSISPSSTLDAMKEFHEF